MSLKRCFLGIVAGAVLCTSALAADTYVIDPVHSSIGFSVKHLMITHVKGTFKNCAGTIVYDESEISKSAVEVHIQTASFDTGNANRDADVKGPNFLDVQKYPEIVFKSNRVEKSGDGYLAHGSLTIHGVSKNVDLPFSLSGKVKDLSGGTRIGAEASLTINRQDYGVSFNKTVDGGGAIVADEVKIDLTAEAVKKN